MRSLLCFDLDGTLIDSRGDIAAAVNHALISSGGAPVSQERITSMVGYGLLKTVEMAVNASGVEIDLKKAGEVTIDYYHRNPIVHTYIYEGVAEGLRKLHENGFVVALFSNKLQTLCETILKILGIRQYFDYIVGAASGFAMKPNPEAIEFMLKDSGSEKSLSYMVGDSSVDMATGRAAEINVCLASYGYGSVGDGKPDLTVSSFDEFVSTMLAGR